jgi:hypothetical protein
MIIDEVYLHVQLKQMHTLAYARWRNRVVRSSKSSLNFGEIVRGHPWTVRGIAAGKAVQRRGLGV